MSAFPLDTQWETEPPTCTGPGGILETIRLAEGWINKPPQWKTITSPYRDHNDFGWAIEIELDIEYIDPNDILVLTYEYVPDGSMLASQKREGVHIEHKPTGTHVKWHGDTSVHRNKAKAIELLRTKLKRIREQGAGSNPGD